MLDTQNSNQNNIDIKAYFGVLAKEKSFIFVFSIAAIIFSLALTYVTSEKYQAATTIFYRPTEINLLKQREIEAFGSPAPTPQFKVINQTLRDAVRNEVVLKPVIKALKLDQKEKIAYPNWYKRWYHEAKDFAKEQMQNLWTILKHGRLIKEDPTFEALEKLRKNIDVIAAKESYIYILKVKDKYPERAAEIINMAGNNLVNWLKNEYQDPAGKSSRQLQEKLNSKENEIKTLQNERQKILDENHLVSIPDETARGLANLYEMELENTKITAEIEKKQKEISEYTKEIQKQTESYVQSEDFKTMQSQKLFDGVKLNGLISESNSIKESVKELKNRLQKLPSLQNKLDSLNVKIEATTREYQNLKDFYTEVFTRVTTARSETRVLHAAEVSSKPVQPIKIYHVGLTALLSLLFSIGLVYILDFFNVQISSPPLLNENADITKSSVGLYKQEKMYNFSLKEFAQKLAAEGGSMFLRQSDGFVLVRSLDPGHAPAYIPFPLRKGSIFEHVLTTGEPLLIEDIETKPEVVASGWTGYADHSLLVFPVQDTAGKVIGVISLHNKISPPFTEADKREGNNLLVSYVSKVVSINDDNNSVENQHSIIRYVLITVCGIATAILVFYLLKKLGY